MTTKKRVSQPGIRRVALNTGGGDAPGLNAVIRAVTKSAINQHNLEVLGIEDAYLGLLEDRVRPGIYYMARTRMVVVENTHNLAGGTLYPLETLRGIKKFAASRGLSVHIDGARLFNACVASGTSASECSAQADTVPFGNDRLRFSTNAAKLLKS